MPKIIEQLPLSPALLSHYLLLIIVSGPAVPPPSPSSLNRGVIKIIPVARDGFSIKTLSAEQILIPLKRRRRRRRPSRWGFVPGFDEEGLGGRGVVDYRLRDYNGLKQMILLRNGNTGVAGVQSGGSGVEDGKGCRFIGPKQDTYWTLSGVFITPFSRARRFKCFRLCLRDSPPHGSQLCTLGLRGREREREREWRERDSYEDSAS